MEKNFMTVDDVAEELSVSKSKAYKIVRQLNKELEEKGSLEKKTEMKRETAESILAKTDLSKSMPKEVYEERLKELQKKMESCLSLY